MSTGVPRNAEGPAVDPIALRPVDEVRITTLVDNVFDGLLAGDDRVTRAELGKGRVTAAQFEGGSTDAGLRAEHGVAALVTVRRGPSTTTLLFDTGGSPDGMVVNADRMGVDLAEVHGVVPGHGHFDHAGGLAGLAAHRGRRAMPMVLHPGAWTRRRIAPPRGEVFDLPTLSRRALAGEGFEVVERREPSHVVDGRGHAGAVNIVRHAQRPTGADRLCALLGGLHLSGPAFEPVIAPTVAALTELAPAMVVPAHCTGWRAQHALAGALPDAWLPGSSGSTYRIAA